MFAARTKDNSSCQMRYQAAVPHAFVTLCAQAKKHSLTLIQKTYD